MRRVLLSELVVLGVKAPCIFLSRGGNVSVLAHWETALRDNLHPRRYTDMSHWQFYVVGNQTDIGKQKAVPFKIRGSGVQPQSPGEWRVLCSFVWSPSLGAPETWTMSHVGPSNPGTVLLGLHCCSPPMGGSLRYATEPVLAPRSECTALETPKRIFREFCIPCCFADKL